MILLPMTINFNRHPCPLEKVEPEWGTDLELLIGFGFNLCSDPSSDLIQVLVPISPVLKYFLFLILL